MVLRSSFFCQAFTIKQDTAKSIILSLTVKYSRQYIFKMVQLFFNHFLFFLSLSSFITKKKSFFPFPKTIYNNWCQILYIPLLQSAISQAMQLSCGWVDFTLNLNYHCIYSLSSHYSQYSPKIYSLRRMFTLLNKNK